MPATTRAYWLHCLAPTHVGTGRGVGYIDLPVYREKVTNWPAFPGSGFKGVWADHYHRLANTTLKTRKDNQKLKAAFGTVGDTGSNAGALIPTDARLLCLPVRSFKGTFAWCTSALGLHLLRRDLDLAGFSALPPPLDDVADEIRTTSTTALKEGTQIYLEDLDFKVSSSHVDDWARHIAQAVFSQHQSWQTEFLRRFAVLPDVIFDYLTTTATEVITRVRIEEATKTVAEGQLWTEESLPAESILAGLVSCDRVYANNGITEQTLLEDFATTELQLQIGGKASVGRGRVRCIFTS